MNRNMIAAALLLAAPAAALTFAATATAAPATPSSPCTVSAGSVKCVTPNGSFEGVYGPGGTGRVTVSNLIGNTDYNRTATGSTITGSIGTGQLGATLNVTKDKATGKLDVTVGVPGGSSVTYSGQPGSLPSVKVNPAPAPATSTE